MEKKILIIDDNTAHNEVMTSLLNEVGYRSVIVSTNGTEGIQKALQEKPHLVILDTLLPDTTGFDVCKTIKDNTALKNTKVVIMTGFIDAVDVIKARQMGADDYIVKTADFSQLLEVVKKLVN